MRADPWARFLFDLALAMGRPVKELLDTIEPAELMLWWARWQVQPWGDRASDARHAIGYAAVCATWGGKISPSDLIPKWDRTEAQKQGVAQMRAWIDAHNARVTGANGGQCR